MGGRTDGLSAILTAASPNLIDALDIQRVMATGMSEQMQSLRRVNQEAQAVEAASAKSAADAKAAADAAVAVRADLQNKQAELQTQIGAVKVRYAYAPPAEQNALTALPPSVMAALGPVVDPHGRNARSGPQCEGPRCVHHVHLPRCAVHRWRARGLRPDHPSGHALDIMIGSDMGLGDAINADLQSGGTLRCCVHDVAGGSSLRPRPRHGLRVASAQRGHRAMRQGKRFGDSLRSN